MPPFASAVLFLLTHVMSQMPYLRVKTISEHLTHHIKLYILNYEENLTITILKQRPHKALKPPVFYHKHFPCSLSDKPCPRIHPVY